MGELLSKTRSEVAQLFVFAQSLATSDAVGAGSGHSDESRSRSLQTPRGSSRRQWRSCKKSARI